jgi:hypothetical protein
MTCRVSSATEWVVLYGSLRMAESILLNEQEIISSRLVNVDIERRPETWFTPCIMISCWIWEWRAGLVNFISMSRGALPNIMKHRLLFTESVNWALEPYPYNKRRIGDTVIFSICKLVWTLRYLSLPWYFGSFQGRYQGYTNFPWLLDSMNLKECLNIIGGWAVDVVTAAFQKGAHRANSGYTVSTI